MLKTFANQSKIPRLPIPKLDSTIQKYLKSCQPVIPSDQYQKTVSIANKFLEGPGPVLQERLQKYEKAQKNGWLEQLWYKKAYLEWSDPIMMNVNWWLQFKDMPVKATSTELIELDGSVFSQLQLQRASEITGRLIDYNELILQEKLQPEYQGRKNPVPLCMNQYKMQFGVTRVPVRGCDEIKVTPGSKHIVVTVKDQIYKVMVYGADGKRLVDSVIAKQLERVVRDAPKQTQPAIGLLTTEDRWVWADVRKSIESRNIHAFRDIDEALFVVNLDDFMYSSKDQFQQYAKGEAKTLGVDLDDTHRIIFHSKNGRNRWFDKSLQFIFMADGHGGVNGEHSPSDAVIPAHIMEAVVGGQDLPSNQSQSKDAPKPELIKWTVDEKVETAIAKAEQRASKDIASMESQLLHFNHYGADEVKQYAQCSPDAYVQMIMQLAYYRSYSTCCPTYESASTRQFLMGRTETIRTCSNESVEWCKLFEQDPAKSVEQFSKAVQAHTRYTIEATNGQGVDRHLLGLRCMVSEQDDKSFSEFFADPSFIQSMTFKLSTSNVSSNVLWGGFGPVFPEGYGINYNIGKKGIKFSISTRHSDKTCAMSFRKVLRGVPARCYGLLPQNLSEMSEQKYSGIDPQVVASIMHDYPDSFDEILSQLLPEERTEEFPDLPQQPHVEALKQLVPGASTFDIQESLRMNSQDPNLALDYLLAMQHRSVEPAIAVVINKAKDPQFEQAPTQSKQKVTVKPTTQSVEHLINQRNDLYERASKAYKKKSVGAGAIAAHYAELGHVKNAQMKEVVLTSASATVINGVLDLHGLQVNQALHVVEQELSAWYERERQPGTRNCTPMTIITGYGRSGSYSKMQVAIERYLIKQGYKFQQVCQGSVETGEFLVQGRQ